MLEWDHVGGITKGLYDRNYGVAFIGNHGTLVVNREGWEVIPEVKDGKPLMEGIALQPADTHDHEKHVKNFVDCIKSKSRAICDVEFGRNSAVLAHMGNISYRTGNKLMWNDANKLFLNDVKANTFLKPEYRAPWKFPVV